MRWTPKVEKKILQQIERSPDREIILPSWAYWEGVDQPWIYVDSLPTPLVRVLYERLIGALPDGAGLQPRLGTSRRSVNPHLWVVVPTSRSRAVCPNGHAYTDDDFIAGVGHRCQACRAAKLLGTPSAADVNRGKTHCPQGHEYTTENTRYTKQGQRRCKTCAREQTAAWRAKKGIA